MKKSTIFPVAIGLAGLAAAHFFFSCGSSSSDSTSDPAKDASDPASKSGSETSGDPQGSQQNSSSTSPNGSSSTPGSNQNTGSNTSTGVDSQTGCTYTANTTVSSDVNSNGCGIITRDTSACEASRKAQGLSGFWLKFSCRITLTKSGSNVIIAADSQPDFESPYFGSTHACYEALQVSGRKTNPNKVVAQTIAMTVPYSPTSGGKTAVQGGVIGISVPGVAIYGNTAAPGDNIYDEVETFDKCEGHPDNKGRFHFHTEPTSISQADDAFIGVMRDGIPVYGRLDMNESTPTLDDKGGHTGVTPDSNGASVYHYHVNHQTEGTDEAYFISKGYYAGTIGSCTGCQ